jgi:hypothetical protein
LLSSDLFQLKTNPFVGEPDLPKPTEEDGFVSINKSLQEKGQELEPNPFYNLNAIKFHVTVE